MIAAAIARAMPVLPEVASIRVSPGWMSPRSSARVIIDSAGRSFTEPAGLLPSSLTRRVFVVGPGRRCRRTSGVLPTQSAMVGYCTVMEALGHRSGQGERYDNGKPGGPITRHDRTL
ncbi:hypothetical protein OF001_U140013 [Pseudomonas sp. OF001]|nr:hypothetical protein OF001_U140013 [Pseudomonas sp. OF001]